MGGGGAGRRGLRNTLPPPTPQTPPLPSSPGRRLCMLLGKVFLTPQPFPHHAAEAPWAYGGGCVYLHTHAELGTGKSAVQVTHTHSAARPAGLPWRLRILRALPRWGAQGQGTAAKVQGSVPHSSAGYQKAAWIPPLSHERGFQAFALLPSHSSRKVCHGIFLLTL